jgi:hypothetical protein
MCQNYRIQLVVRVNFAIHRLLTIFKLSIYIYIWSSMCVYEKQIDMINIWTSNVNKERAICLINKSLQDVSVPHLTSHFVRIS